MREKPRGFPQELLSIPVTSEIKCDWEGFKNWPERISALPQPIKEDYWCLYTLMKIVKNHSSGQLAEECLLEQKMQPNRKEKKQRGWKRLRIKKESHGLSGKGQRWVPLPGLLQAELIRNVGNNEHTLQLLCIVLLRDRILDKKPAQPRGLAFFG